MSQCVCLASSAWLSGLMLRLSLLLGAGLRQLPINHLPSGSRRPQRDGRYMLTKQPNSFRFSCALNVLQNLAFALRSRIAASCASISRAPAMPLLTIRA